MTLKTIVKVSHITNLSDARYCAGMGVDMLGFCFSKNSEYYIETDKFQEIIGWVSGVNIIIEFGDESIEETKEALANIEFDGIQSSNIDVANYWKTKGKRVIYTKIIDSNNDIEELEKNINELNAFDYILISKNKEDENLSQKLESKLIDWSGQFKILKAFDISSHSIEQQVNENSFHGIALTGGHEEKPGTKDYDEIADILEVLEMEG